MNTGVLAKLVETGACVPGSKVETWPWSAAFAAAKVASWASRSIIGSAAAAMLSVCCLLVSTIFVVEAVDSAIESQLLWLQVIGSSEESRTAALKWSALQKRGQQRLGLEEGSTLWQRVDIDSFQQIRR